MNATDPATYVTSKLEELFESLDDSQRRVLSEMVRYSLLRAAEKYVGEEPGDKRVPEFVSGLHPSAAPNLVRSLNMPGALVAYSPGCASVGLLELGDPEARR